MPSLKDLEQQARDHSRRGDTKAAERACRAILEQDESHLSSLHFLADVALQTGDLAAAETRLRRIIELTPGEAQRHSQLGQVLYRQGKQLEAVVAYQRYWELNPRNPMVYLSLGCLLVELGDTEKAAQVFSLGESVDASLLGRWRDSEAHPGLQEMSRTGWQTLREHHTALHLETVQRLGDAEATARIRDARWPLLDARDFDYREPGQRAQVFYIEYPEAPAFYEREALPWCAGLEQQFDELRREVLAGLDLAADGRPYLGDGHQLQGEQWQPLVNTMNWASVHLYSRGVANEKLVNRFPRTLAALEQVPVATFRGNPMEVFISVLAPHTRIPEHFGVSSAILTVHLPISVPQGCGLQVAGETRVPVEGQILAFDDTWEHSAWNDSDEQRVVLIFELWHPQLSEIEKEAVLQTFYARDDWLQQRSVS